MVNSDRTAAAEVGRHECSPCRGTGKVTSTLGGTPHVVRCPWCEGTGAFQPGRDAQAGDPAEAAP